MDKMKITLWAEAGTPTLTRTAEGRADVVTTITGTRETIEIKEDEELRVTSEGHWKIGVINAEAAGGFTVDLQVLDPDRLYERHTLTPVGFSRFGCSLMLEGEVGHDAEAGGRGSDPNPAAGDDHHPDAAQSGTCSRADSCTDAHSGSVACADRRRRVGINSKSPVT